MTSGTLSCVRKANQRNDWDRPMQLGLAEEPRAGYLLNTPIASCSFRYQRWRLDQGSDPDSNRDKGSKSFPVSYKPQNLIEKKSQEWRGIPGAPALRTHSLSNNKQRALGGLHRGGVQPYGQGSLPGLGHSGFLVTLAPRNDIRVEHSGCWRNEKQAQRQWTLTQQPAASQSPILGMCTQLQSDPAQGGQNLCQNQP